MISSPGMVLLQSSLAVATPISILSDLLLHRETATQEASKVVTNKKQADAMTAEANPFAEFLDLLSLHLADNCTSSQYKLNLIHEQISKYNKLLDQLTMSLSKSKRNTVKL